MAPGVISVFIIFFVKEKNTPAKQQSKEISVKLNLKELPANLKLFISFLRCRSNILPFRRHGRFVP